MANLFNRCQFLISAYKMSQLPPDEGMEIAFAGRSNAGKSTTINALTNHKGLAKVSKTPGRTQLFNCFEFAPNRRLVDLPGYGYAKVPIKMRKHWDQEINNYLMKRQSLIGVVIIQDIRHPMKDFDQQMITWAFNSGMRSHVILNKADKLKNSQAKQTLMRVKKQIAGLSKTTTCQMFSALRKEGTQELSGILLPWFEEEQSYLDQGQDQD